MDGAEAARIIYGGSMPEKTVRDVLHEIQKSIIVGKSRFNKFGNYHYRSAEDIVDAVKALLPIGASLKITDEMIMLGNRFYIKATAMLLYKEGSEEACGYAREAEVQKGMSEGQITGSTSSYARKYALNGLFAIDDGVDADSQDNRNITLKPVTKIELTFEEKLIKAEEFVAKYLEELSNTAYNDIVNLDYNYEKQLKSVHLGYPELSRKIKDAVTLKTLDATNLLNEFKAA